METQAIRHPRFSTVSPDLAEAGKAHVRVQYLLSLLPEALRENFQNETYVIMGKELPFSVWYYPPRSFVVDVKKIENPAPEDLIQFYEAVGTFFAEKMREKIDFRESWFVTQFVHTALTRHRQNVNYIPPIEIPSATNFFLQNIWSSKNAEIDFSKEWEIAEQQAKDADPYRWQRKTGIFLLRSPTVHFLGTAVQEAVRFLKKHEWEVNSVLLGESDPSTLKSRTTFRVQGIWKKLTFFGAEKNGKTWQIYPTATTEARFSSPAMASDLLFLGGGQLLLSGNNRMVFDISPQAGFSTKKLLLYENWIPGAEMAVNLTSPLPDWQLSAVAQYGFAQYGEPDSTVLGLVFKWIL